MILLNTLSQLSLLRQKEDIYVMVLLKGSSQNGPFSTEQEDQRHRDVLCRIPVSHHLEQRGLGTAAILLLV